MKPNQDASYYNRYRGAARRFELIGGALLLIAIILNLATGNRLFTVALLVAAAGAFLLVIGGSSLRPHNLVKAFAQQCAREPGHEIAQGLLDAMESDKKIRLVQRSINEVEMAIGIYEQLEDADPELIRQLHAAKEAHIAKKAF